MITIPELTAQALGSFLASETRGRFAASNADLGDLLPNAARLALDCIGNSDALYHHVEHSMLVTLAGHDILIGRALVRPTTADDYGPFDRSHYRYGAQGPDSAREPERGSFSN